MFSVIMPVIAITPVNALEPVETHAARSSNIIRINGTRTPLRAYEIDGDTYINLFEVAVALSGSANQFALRWDEKSKSLYVIDGVPQAGIGLNLSRVIKETSRATPVEINIILDGETVSVSVFDIANEYYFDLRGVARVLDFCVNWYTSENIIEINTDQPFEDSTVIRSIDPEKPMIALTFDDGPSYVTTMILDALEKHGAVATFYITGNRIERNENNREIVRRAFEMGNEIANHSWSHRWLNRSSDDVIRRELSNTNEVIKSITGAHPANMRPPYAGLNGRVMEIAAEIGLPIILWSVDPSDWRTRNANTTFYHVMEHIKDRDIVLLHDLWEPTGEAAVRLIPALIERGFQLVTVSELMHHSGIDPVPGVVYNSAVMR